MNIDEHYPLSSSRFMFLDLFGFGLFGIYRAFLPFLSRTNHESPGDSHQPADILWNSVLLPLSVGRPGGPWRQGWWDCPTERHPESTTITSASIRFMAKSRPESQISLKSYCKKTASVNNEAAQTQESKRFDGLSLDKTWISSEHLEPWWGAKISSIPSSAFSLWPASQLQHVAVETTRESQFCGCRCNERPHANLREGRRASAYQGVGASWQLSTCSSPPKGRPWPYRYRSCKWVTSRLKWYNLKILVSNDIIGL